MAKIVIMTGAGISAESGISTFRGTTGLWEEYSISDVCTDGCLDENYELVVGFYDRLRQGLKEKQPNRAHEVIAFLKSRFPDDIAVITQNIDDLFERAGCKDVLHLHGTLKELRCTFCGTVFNIGYEAQGEEVQWCPSCSGSGYLRPNIVFFGENPPRYSNMFAEMRDCELFVVIGTSGNVIDVADQARGRVRSILNNLEPSDAIDDTRFDKVLYKKATEAVEEIAQEMVTYLGKDHLVWTPYMTVSARTLLATFIDLILDHPDPSSWSEEAFMDDVPSLIRLKQLQAMFRAFDIESDWEGFYHGRFISNRERAYYTYVKHLQELIPLKKSTMSGDIRDVFRFLLQYRINVQQVTYYTKPILACLSLHAIAIKQIRNTNQVILDEMKQYDDLLVEIIDPEERGFGFGEMVERFGFPEDDLWDADLEAM
jgi:NAD-dependent deacetylase